MLSPHELAIVDRTHADEFESLCLRTCHNEAEHRAAASASRTAAPALPRFGLPVAVRLRCADVVPVVLQSDVSVATAILDIATLLLWSSAATVT